MSSARVRTGNPPVFSTVVDLVRYPRMEYPVCKIVIMDDSVYLPDIIEIALKQKTAVLTIMRLDGRVPAPERQAVIDRFSTTPAAILLASRAAGGSGLNLQAAKVMILCNYSEHTSQEDQAIGQAWRRGQTQSVHVFTLQALEVHTLTIIGMRGWMN